MSAIIDGSNRLPATADDGDVQPDGLGIGFSPGALDLAAAEEELAELEMRERSALGEGDRRDDDETGLDGLTGEVGSDATALGADDGDPGTDVLGLGFGEDQLRLAEEDDELDAIERQESVGLDEPSVLPDELEAGTAESAPVGAGDVLVGLVDQPTASPTRKVKAAGLGGVLGAIPAPILSLLDLLPVSDAVLGAISAALTLLGSLAAAYLTRERAA